MKIQIREINDMLGNNYKIYDLMDSNKHGLWSSIHTYLSLKDALKSHPSITIEDTTLKDID